MGSGVCAQLGVQQFCPQINHIMLGPCTSHAGCCDCPVYWQVLSASPSLLKSR